VSGFLVPLDRQTFDNNGDPLAGGKLYAFAAGTATPLAIYTTSALNVATANPLILDAAGRWTAFIQDGVVYDFQLKDTNGVLIDAWSNVSIPTVPAIPATTSVPTGGLVPFAGAAAPTGFLLCDGTAVSRSTYAALFAICGTAYGVGNGSTTFNLPDLRGRFPMGKSTAGTGATLGESGGTIDHVHTGPSHTHGVAGHTHTIAHTHTVPYNGWTTTLNTPPLAGILQAGGSGAGSEASVTQANANNTTGASSAANSGSTALTTDAAGTGNTGSANPPYQTFSYVIKT
jgi:microcystin-dependent protein